MDQSRPETSVGAGATSRPPVGRVWWLLVFAALSTAGLAALTCALIVVHALAYGAATVMAPEASAAAPDSGRYVLATAVGIIVHLATASASAWLAARTAIRTWRPVAQALAASLVAVTLACCALLLTLGVDPLAFLLDP